MRYSKPLLFLCVALSLSACQTLDSAFDNISGVFDSALDATSTPSRTKLRGDPATVFSSKCPRISIVKELSALNEFTEPRKPKDKNLISSVTIEQLDTSCRLADDNVIIDIKLAFHSELGAQAKIRNNDKPFFAYPFFVAITDPRGTILAKEVFAASMTYDRKETAHTYYENIRQIIPLTRRSTAGSYHVYLGFQLSDEQLSYNRKTMAPPPEIMIQTETEQPEISGLNAPAILHPTLQTNE